MVIGGSVVVGCDGQIQWWVGRPVMGGSVVVGCDGQIQWWVGRPVMVGFYFRNRFLSRQKIMVLIFMLENNGSYFP